MSDDPELKTEQPPVKPETPAPKAATPPEPPKPVTPNRPEVNPKKTAFLQGEPTRDWREPEKYVPLKAGEAEKIQAAELEELQKFHAKRKKAKIYGGR